MRWVKTHQAAITTAKYPASAQTIPVPLLHMISANAANGITNGLSHSLVIVTRERSDPTSASEKSPGPWTIFHWWFFASSQVLPPKTEYRSGYVGLPASAQFLPNHSPQPIATARAKQAARAKAALIDTFRCATFRDPPAPSSVAATIQTKRGKTTTTTAGYLQATAPPARYPAKSTMAVKPRPLVAVAKSIA